MNPATVSLEKAQMLHDFGVNRISMGVQSWDPEMLDRLGRAHSAQQAERSFGILREAGFANLNLDLMFGIPGQSIETWEQSLRKTIQLAPEHISAYCLTFEEDTEFFRRHQRGEDVVVGVVEAHGRPRTAELAAQLEQIPRKQIEYKGVVFEEMDLDAVIARRPQIVLIDELAHGLSMFLINNAGGKTDSITLQDALRHTRRTQDPI